MSRCPAPWPLTFLRKDLSPRPETICASAWEGVFAAQFGIWADPIERHWDADNKERHWTGGYEYTISPSAWLACAASGCSWCQFLERHFLKTQQESDWPVPTVNIRVGSEDVSHRVDTAVEKLPGTVDTITIVVNDNSRKFDVYTDSDDPASPRVNGRTRIPDVGSPRTLALTKACIEECVRDHDRCQAITLCSTKPTTLPTRLIDCSDPCRVRVVKTDDSTCGPYAALSYVWGKDRDQTHRCTRTNLSSYMVGVDPTNLPQTIRDAIHVAHALGIPFLWTDGLCIIQDAPEDMNRELASMRDVYRHAYLTIDAASASSVADGFLQDRRPLDPEVMLPWICPDGQIGVVYLVVRNPYSDSPNPDVLTCGWDETSYTNTRAWCLQEALLSTRSLVFTSQTVQLRCHSGTRNIGGAQHRADADLCRLPDAIFHLEQPFAHGSEEWRSIRKSWCGAVQDYSRRSLSDPSDKLVACAGLAELFARVLRSDYLAGLWRDSLLRDLLWERCRFSDYQGRPRGYRAPSWSWASLDVGVDFMTSSSGEPLVEVLECTVTLKDKTLLPFGPVIDGSLVLRTRWRLHPCKKHTERPHGRSGTIQLQSRRARQSSHTTAHENSDDKDRLLSSYRRNAELCDATFDCEDDIEAEDLWILPILRQHHTIAMSGLILRIARVEQDPQGILYRRVGSWLAYRFNRGLKGIRASDEWYEITII
ncbi:heterokaryon incompatibility protein-domain-containing protein [Cubamyces lactineus]|nr:heterokaryon incompatibility protein-domain-containing protein [Cubamyces lactineus]